MSNFADSVCASIANMNDKDFLAYLQKQTTIYGRVDGNFKIIVDAGIASGIERIIHSQNFDRLNMVVKAINTPATKHILNTVKRLLPVYLNARNLIEYNGKVNVFFANNYNNLLDWIANFRKPDKGFFEWAKSYKAQKENKPLAADKAYDMLAQITASMGASTDCLTDATLAEIYATLDKWLLEKANHCGYIALREANKLA